MAAKTTPPQTMSLGKLAAPAMPAPSVKHPKAKSGQHPHNNLGKYLHKKKAQ